MSYSPQTKRARICRLPYDASKPVDTFWDLGYFDNVAIWLAQSIGFEFRFLPQQLISAHKCDFSTARRALVQRAKDHINVSDQVINSLVQEMETAQIVIDKFEGRDVEF